MAVAALLFGVSSCTSTLPLRLERFVDNVEKNASKYTEKDWEKVSEKFKALTNEYEKAYEKLSREDRERIDKAIGPSGLHILSHFITVPKKGTVSAPRGL